MDLWLLVTAFAISLAVTETVRRLAQRMALLDIPVDRSLHTVPTPRGGGLGIAISVLAVATFWVLTTPAPTDLIPLLVLGACAAGLGFWDDKKPLSAKFRLIVQFVIAAALLASFITIFPKESVDKIFETSTPLWISMPILLFLTVWMTNLYNFMDGSDGLAGAQSASVFFALTLLCVSNGDPEAAALTSILTAASIGFLFLNWQPAKIFMGDVGSIFLGFISAATAIWLALRGEISFIAALCLHGAFVVDATATLFTRIRLGKIAHQAHRSHCYQRWIQEGRSHKFVALVYTMINLFWLFPLAIVIERASSPGIAHALLVIAWLPIAIFVVYKKAGHDFIASKK
jgi:Fuc2NAc and GlcNAc transferase